MDSARRSSRISAPTSGVGRLQLSDENAYSVTVPTRGRSRRRFDDLARRANAGAMSGGSRQPTSGGPSAVAVHDDADVNSVEWRRG